MLWVSTLYLAPATRTKSGKTGKGNKWLRSGLTESANAAARTKNTYLAAQYQRLRGRRGHSKAITAVGHPNEGAEFIIDWPTTVRRA